MKELHKSSPALSRDETVKLIDELHTASEIYYQRGEESPLTDEEFDAKQELLSSIADSGAYDELFVDGSRGFTLLEAEPGLGTQASGEVIHHELPMLSLAKAKKEPELRNYLRKASIAGAKNFRLQAKMDGLAVAAEYFAGKLVRLSTRGNGRIGEDVTYLVESPNVTVQGLALTVREPGRLEVRGELFFTEEQFQRVNKLRMASTGVAFKNSRNSAVGLLKAAKQGVSYAVEFSFTAYSVIRGGEPAELNSLSSEEFLTIDEFTAKATPELQLENFANYDAVMEAIHRFGEARQNFRFPTDGVVVKPSNEVEMLNRMGYSSHHPASQIAWKYAAEKAPTEVLGIDVTVGRSGRITPVARVRPVELDGSMISNASLHNFNLIVTKGVRVGSLVMIEKANEIIPQIVAVISNPESTEEFPVPSKCPSCGSLLSFDRNEKIWPPKTLLCPNDECEGRKFSALKTAVGKAYMDIDGMSESTLDYLNGIGRVKSMVDIYTLTVQELANSGLGETESGAPRRLGETRARHIHRYIQLSKERALVNMLPALSISLLGPSSVKALQRRFGDIDGILKATEEQIAALDGFGPVKAKKIYEGLRSKRPLIDQLRAAGVTFGKGQKIAAPVSSEASQLAGKSFSISGAVPPGFANRGKWVAYVESAGGEFHSSPKAETSFMIGDPSESSAKVQKARKLGLTFMSPEEFTSRYGNR